jgi:hypothetical protein
LQDVYGGGDSVFFELLYPVVQFQPTNLKIPILILYKTYYYIINKFSNKLDRMYLQEHIFEDEQNWFFNYPTNISYWGVSTIAGESYIHGKKDVLRFASTSKIYTLNIYFDLGIIYYTRKYKKLYEILGEVFPIISTVWTILAFFSRIINEIKMAKKLNEHIISYDLKERKNINENKRNKKSLKIFKLFKDNINNNILNTNNIKSINNGSGKKNNNKINKNTKLSKYKNISINPERSNNVIPMLNNTIEDSSKIFCNQNNININITPQRHKKNFRRSNTIIMNPKVDKIDFSKKKEKFPLKDYFFGFFYNKIDIHKSKGYKLYCLSNKFNKSFSFFRHLIDITSYFSIYKDYEIFKKIICDKLNINEPELSQTDFKNLDKNNKLFKEDNADHSNSFKKKLSMSNFLIKLNNC